MLYLGSEADDSSQTSQEPHAPHFLLPVLREIVLAGKSMEMLESLGRKSEFVENRDKGGLWLAKNHDETCIIVN